MVDNGRAMHRCACAWLLIVAGCAGGPRASLPPASGARTTASVASDGGWALQVQRIFERRHLRPRRWDDRLSAELWDGLLARWPGCARTHPELLAQRSRLDDALRAGDASFAMLASERCGVSRLDGARARARMLEVLARLYDPHSAYLDPRALSERRRAVHAPPLDAPRVQARVVSRRGVRVGHVQVPELYLRAGQRVSTDLRVAARVLAERGAQVMLLDLRGNGGGVQHEAVAMAGALAGPGPVLQVMYADRQVELLDSDAEAAWRGPLVVAVDALTASHAEVLAAALQDRERAVIVGQRTQGKGTGQALVMLGPADDPGAGALQISDRRFHRLDGKPLQWLGVQPDVELPAVGRAASAVTERDRPGVLRFGSIPGLDPEAIECPIDARDDRAEAAAVLLLRDQRL
jgi:hypothetical protein